MDFSDNQKLSEPSIFYHQTSSILSSSPPSIDINNTINLSFTSNLLIPPIHPLEGYGKETKARLDYRLLKNKVILFFLYIYF